MKEKNGRCPRCDLPITSSYRPYGWVILGRMLVSGCSGAALALVAGWRF